MLFAVIRGIRLTVKLFLLRFGVLRKLLFGLYFTALPFCSLAARVVLHCFFCVRNSPDRISSNVAQVDVHVKLVFALAKPFEFGIEHYAFYLNWLAQILASIEFTHTLRRLIILRNCRHPGCAKEFPTLVVIPVFVYDVIIFLNGIVITIEFHQTQPNYIYLRNMYLSA